jgi:hypothetical protein
MSHDGQIGSTDVYLGLLSMASIEHGICFLVSIPDSSRSFGFASHHHHLLSWVQAFNLGRMLKSPTLAALLLRYVFQR